MKKKVLSLLFLIAIASYGQVGIGTPLPDASAQLDIVSSDKGLLIPRVALVSITDTITITAGNVTSLMVFNTNKASGLTHGYYYWFNNQWNRVLNENDVNIIDTNTTNDSIEIAGSNLVINDSDGGSISIPLADINTGLDTNTTNDSIEIAGSNLVINDSDGGSISIPLADINTGLDTNTINDSIEIIGTNLVINDSDGGSISIPLADINTGIDTNNNKN